jgi:lactate racemase
MLDAQAVSPQGKVLSQAEIRETLGKGLDKLAGGQKILVLIPDHTRSLPLPFLFRVLVDLLHKSRQLDFMVALGTHPPLDQDSLNMLVGITAEERNTMYRHIGLSNHAWEDGSQLTSLGVMEKDEIKTIAGDCWHPTLPDRVEIRINKSALAYDRIVIVGPTFPHEVAGFSGGVKYLFPGISGPEMIHATHWLGALGGILKTIGIKDTPVRRMIHSAAAKLGKPVTLVSLVMDGHGVAGVFIGDVDEAWNSSVDHSAQRNIIWCEKPYNSVLSCAPAMYDELWTAAKAVYKLEPVMAVGGDIILYAPHLDTVSRVHEKYIYQVGYHTLPYFLKQWESFNGIPLGVLAHSTHVRGAGTFEKGVEKPRIRVTLASKISPEDCARLNLGYLDPSRVDFSTWKENRQENMLLVPNAGEKLYRLKTI